jgi:hypothetical protein
MATEKVYEAGSLASEPSDRAEMAQGESRFMIRPSWYRVSRMANDDARLILREKDTVFEGLQNVGLSPFDFEWQVEKNYREPRCVSRLSQNSPPNCPPTSVLLVLKLNFNAKIFAV